VVQIVTLTGTLSDTSENGVTSVVLGNVVDQLLNEHSLSDTGTSEETNLTTTGIGGEQVDDLDTGNENLGNDGLIDELGSLAMNGGGLLGVYGTTLIDRLTDDVDDTAQALGTDGDGDGGTGILDSLATDQTLGTVHGNGTDGVLSQVLGDLEDQAAVQALDLKSVENGGELALVELNVDDGTNDGANLTSGLGIGGIASLQEGGVEGLGGGLDGGGALGETRDVAKGVHG